MEYETFLEPLDLDLKYDEDYFIVAAALSKWLAEFLADRENTTSVSEGSEEVS